jgi:4-diphosphocytidyl-2-C-methyl-D-erythritol kinase
LAPAAGFAGAKVNLYLHVGALGADGYHPIDSLMLFADVGDRLTATPAPAFSLTVSGPFAGATPASPANLVWRAARTLHEAPGLAIHLDKILPVAAGIGGGSADAAAALRLVNQALKLGFNSQRLQDIGVGLGADVPACVGSVPVVARGRGEQLSPAPRLPEIHAVLVNPGVAVPTGPIFAAFDAGPLPGTLDPRLPAAFDTVQDLATWLTTKTRNDLQAAALSLAPAAGEAIDILGASSLTLLARMSGSGATAFALCANAPDAQALAAAVRTARPNWWVACCRLGGPWG